MESHLDSRGATSRASRARAKLPAAALAQRPRRSTAPTVAGSTGTPTTTATTTTTEEQQLTALLEIEETEGGAGAPRDENRF
jgi:hypothetical protein